jgi:beta-mannosidase
MTNLSFLARYSYFSQIMQSYALELAITTLRCSKPYNMGSLYWQLNDVWPVTSWSTIDYYGVKKAAHYKIRQIYEPLSVLVFNKNVTDKGSYEIMIVNDYNVNFDCVV